jgi:phosphoglycerate dehydrogenase-like enzyme
MYNQQVVMMKRYATKINIEKIYRISADAKVTLFDVKKRYPKISKIRGGLRLILPFTAYKFISHRLDHLSEKQKLIWIDSPAKFSCKNTALLFPPNVESNVAEELISELNPSWIHSIMTGIDRLSVIPGTTLVTNSRGIHSLRIAEFVMAVIFAFSKNLPEHINQGRNKIWKSLSSKMVRGASIGIVGLGSIGKEIAKLAKLCGMVVWATRRKIVFNDFVDHLLPPEELQNMLREVDYVVIAVPLIGETINLIGKAEIEMMKSTACLINVARGAVVDEDSLYYALKKKFIRGACIDVFKDEKPLPKNSRFYKLKNLLITSFSTYYSDDSKEQVMDLFFMNLERFINGKPLINLADKSQLTYQAEAFT